MEKRFESRGLPHKEVSSGLFPLNLENPRGISLTLSKIETELQAIRGPSQGKWGA
jgi:hypothetical protein